MRWLLVFLVSPFLFQLRKNQFHLSSSVSRMHDIGLWGKNQLIYGIPCLVEELNCHHTYAMEYTASISLTYKFVRSKLSVKFPCTWDSLKQAIDKLFMNLGCHCMAIVVESETEPPTWFFLNPSSKPLELAYLGEKTDITVISEGISCNYLTS